MATNQKQNKIIITSMILFLITIILLPFLKMPQYADAEVTNVYITETDYAHVDYDEDNEGIYQTVVGKLSPLSYPTNYTEYVKFDSESYVEITTHSRFKTRTYTPMIPPPEVKYTAYYDLASLSAGTHTYYFKVVDHDDGDKEYTDSWIFIKDGDPSAYSINLTANTYDDRYFNTNPQLEVGTYDVDGLDDAYLTIGDYSGSNGSKTTTLTKESADLNYNETLTLTNYNHVNETTITIGDRYQEGDYAKYKDVTFTNPTSASLTNIIAYIEVAYDSDMQSDFDDVCFYDSTGTTLLDFELASYTASTTGYFWVEIPSISASSTYVSRMFYGHATASSLEDLSGTWDDNGFINVLHVDGDASESSGNSITWTSSGSPDFNGNAKVGTYGMELDNTAYIYNSGYSDTDGESTFTILYWQYSDTTDYQTVYGKDVASGNDFSHYIETKTAPADDDLYSYFGGSYDTLSGHMWDVTTYVYHALTWDSTTLTYYVNGASEGTDTISGSIGNGGTTKWGKRHDTTWGFDGVLDELMFCTEVLDSDEIHAFYDFMNDQASFVSFGSESDNVVVNNTITVTYIEDDSDDGFYHINFTASETCLFDATIIYNYTTYYILLYSSSSDSSSIDYFQVNTTIWNYLSEGEFWINITAIDDTSTTNLATFKCYKVTTGVTLTILSPTNSSFYEITKPIALVYTVDITWGNTWTEAVYLNNTITDYSSANSLLLSAGFWNITVYVWDVAGNAYSDTIHFEVVDFETCRITYLTYYDNKIDFDRFNTRVTTSRFNNVTELDSYVLVEENDTIDITVTNEDDVFMSNQVFNFSEHIFMELPIHFLTFTNLNNTYDVLIYLRWTFDDSTYYTKTITVNGGTIGEQLMIYREAYYTITYSSTEQGIESLTEQAEGFEIKHGSVPLNLHSDAGIGTLKWSSLLTGLITVLGGIGFIWGLFARIGQIENKTKRNAWAGIIFVGTFAVGLIGFFISGASWQPILVSVAVIIIAIIWFKREGIL